MITIAAEHFTLTPSIRTHIESALSKLKDLLPRDASVHVFLSETARKDVHKTFMVLCKLRIFGKDMIIREENENLHAAIETARMHLTRKVVEEKHHWVRLRRKNSDLEDRPSAQDIPFPVTA